MVENQGELEVELKFPTIDLNAVARRLTERGAMLLQSGQQIDEYWSHPTRDFSQTDEALRVRRCGNEVRLTFKGPKQGQVAKSRREIELLFSPDTTASDVSDLLLALGFQRIAEVRKVRTEYSLRFDGHLVHAALDQVSGVGTFVELESRANEANRADKESGLAKLGKLLHLENPTRESYLAMQLNAPSEESPARRE